MSFIDLFVLILSALFGDVLFCLWFVFNYFMGVDYGYGKFNLANSP